MPASTLKRLVLCLDGTWNNADGKGPLTNVVRLRNLVDYRYRRDGAGEDEEQRIYYDAGVGTGMFDRIRGGVFGHGLAENVQQAYRFLSQFYAPGIEIYVFGFSRGAFTARSLVGYVGAAGLLKPECCTPEMEARCWAYYRTPPGDRYPSEKAELSKYTYPNLRVSCIGVFDTVGALGVPLDAFSMFNRRYQFHDTTLSSIVDHALHAIAVDEMRGPFQAAVWARPQHENNLSIEQVWFPGVHSNIGGGYLDVGLSNLTLEWMIKRMQSKKLGLVFDNAAANIEANSCGKLEDSRNWLYTYSKFKPRVRVINHSGQASLGNRLSDLKPNDQTIGEMLHWSVLKRWKESMKPNSQIDRYNPRNVAAALETIYKRAPGGELLGVVGENNEPLNWLKDDKDFDFLLNLMPSDEYRKGLTVARATSR